jgi:hypothetical protein
LFAVILRKPEETVEENKASTHEVQHAFSCYVLKGVRDSPTSTKPSWFYFSKNETHKACTEDEMKADSRKPYMLFYRKFKATALGRRRE